MNSVSSSGQRAVKRILSCDAIGVFLVSLVAISVGLAMFCRNEQSAMLITNAIEDEMHVLIRLANIDVAYQENNDKLVYLSGELNTLTRLVDPIFKLNMQTVKLKRETFMYQWTVAIETKEVDVGDRVKNEQFYSFEKKWVNHLVKLDYKGHKNPSVLPIPSLTLIADATYVGCFRLSQALVAQITKFYPLKLSSNAAQMIKSSKVIADKKLPKMHLKEGILYFSDDPDSPKIGDIMIKFSYAGLSVSEDNTYGPAETVSIVGRQKGKMITRFLAENGSYIEQLRIGNVEPEVRLLLLVRHDFTCYLFYFRSFFCLIYILTVLKFGLCV